VKSLSVAIGRRALLSSGGSPTHPATSASTVSLFMTKAADVSQRQVSQAPTSAIANISAIICRTLLIEVLPTAESRENCVIPPA
jgi:hypothetical protein